MSLRGTLAYRAWPFHRADDLRGCIVFLHGWGDHGGHYEWLARRLVAGGFSCLAPDFVGHGRSPGVRARVHSIEPLLRDLDAFLVETCPNTRVFLCGHSMGGALAAHYAIRQPERVAGVIFNSAAIAVNREVPWLKRGLCDLLGNVWPALPMGTLKEPGHMARSLTAQEVYRRDTLIHHGGIDAGTGRCLLRAARWIERHGQRLAVPFLALQGLDDKLVAVDGPRRLVEQTGAHGTVIEFPEARHDLLLDLGVDRVAGAMLSWLHDQVESGDVGEKTTANFSASPTQGSRSSPQ